MIRLLCFLLLFPQTENSTTIPSVSKNLQQHFGYSKDKPFLLVNIQKQEMHEVKNEAVEKTYRISSSKYGIGNKQGSGKTPLGVHKVGDKFGKGAPSGTIFVGRQNTGKMATIFKDSVDVNEDHVTTRILWLEGLEEKINKGKGIDSHDRYIYIHGTPEEGLIGKPASHGCIRMKNSEVIELFEKVEKGTFVVIVEELVDGYSK